MDKTLISPAVCGQSTTMTCRVGVRDFAVDARIGAHDHEKTRRQRLLVSVELVTCLPDGDHLSSAFDYATIPAIIEELAAGHICLIEEFGARIAERCAAHPAVASAVVRVEKPPALPNGMAWATISLVKTGGCAQGAAHQTEQITG